MWVFIIILILIFLLIPLCSDWNVHSDQPHLYVYVCLCVWIFIELRVRCLMIRKENGCCSCFFLLMPVKKSDKMPVLMKINKLVVPSLWNAPSSIITQFLSIHLFFSPPSPLLLLLLLLLLYLLLIIFRLYVQIGLHWTNRKKERNMNDNKPVLMR